MTSGACWETPQIEVCAGMYKIQSVALTASQSYLDVNKCGQINTWTEFGRLCIEADMNFAATSTTARGGTQIYIPLLHLGVGQSWWVRIVEVIVSFSNSMIQDLLIQCNTLVDCWIADKCNGTKLNMESQSPQDKPSVPCHIILVPATWTKWNLHCPDISIFLNHITKLNKSFDDKVPL